MSLRYTEISTPLGAVRVGVSDAGVRAVGFLGERDDAVPGPDWRREPALRHPAIDQLRAYFAGTLRRFELALDPVGTEFQQQVWRALGEVPFGETASYAAIARRFGRPTATRAVGAANGRNPIAIIVPCHRIIGAGGALTGYAAGIERKRWLLAHEARLAGRQLALALR